MSADRGGLDVAVMKERAAPFILPPQQTGCSNDSPENTALPLTLKFSAQLGDC